MLPETTVAAIRSAVEENFEHQIAFLQDVVRQPSLRGEEAGVQAVVEAALKTRGYEIFRQPLELDALRTHPAGSPATIAYENTYNVIGRKTPDRTRGRSLILNAHVDVVPTADPSHWTHPPFSAHRDGNWLFGRGAGDMKAGLSANLFAVDAIEAAGLCLQAPLEFQSVIDEEVTGNGAAMTIINGANADAVLIPEPTDEDLIFANSGVIKFRICLTGIPAHPREPESGLSAIEAAMMVIDELKQMEAEWNLEKVDHAGFDSLANPSSLNIGTITGGEWAASVPFACEFSGRIGFYPGDAPEDRMQAVENLLAGMADKDPRFKSAPPKLEWIGTCQKGYRLEGGSDAEVVLGDAHKSVHGTSLQRSIMACYLDAALFSNYVRIPALTYGPVSKNIHGIDEKVDLQSLRRVTETIALFVASWCGVRQE